MTHLPTAASSASPTPLTAAATVAIRRWPTLKATAGTRKVTTDNADMTPAGRASISIRGGDTWAAIASHPWTNGERRGKPGLANANKAAPEYNGHGDRRGPLRTGSTPLRPTIGTYVLVYP